MAMPDQASPWPYCTCTVRFSLRKLAEIHKLPSLREGRRDSATLAVGPDNLEAKGGSRFRDVKTTAFHSAGEIYMASQIRIHRAKTGPGRSVGGVAAKVDGRQWRRERQWRRRPTELGSFRFFPAKNLKYEVGGRLQIRPEKGTRIPQNSKSDPTKSRGTRALKRDRIG
ncbi:hypothetical protein CRG98_021007 [Punica granatum]|uniref:Uncharacterized protein n=1 Tax=Punica granatum TaxID=22663 RepID=A0A2I0JQP3_PUNGR|nr:hypothetical protein CRG98_021007 [Punica granatum]